MDDNDFNRVNRNGLTHTQVELRDLLNDPATGSLMWHAELTKALTEALAEYKIVNGTIMERP